VAVKRPTSTRSPTPKRDADLVARQTGAGSEILIPLSVLWTYSSPKDLAPRVARPGEAGATPAEIRIRCLGCNVQWIACQGKPGDRMGSFEQADGHVHVICPGCRAEGRIDLAELEKGKAGGRRA